MTDLHYLLIIFIPSILWVILCSGHLLRKRKQKGISLPRPGDGDVIFVERAASGSSDKSWATRLGGAQNCLTVIVTRSHFAVTSYFPFTIFVDMYDLEHLVPLSKINNVKKEGRTVWVKVQLEDGGVRTLTLCMRKSAEFVQKIQDAQARGV